MHRFQCNELSLFAGNDVITISTQGRFRSFLKEDPDIFLAFNCYFTSIVHRIQFNELVLFTGNDVNTIS